MTTLDKNKLLADFIALDKGEFEILLPKYGWFDERKDKNSSKFSFHNDWNWLMLVVLKCKSSQPIGNNNLLIDIYDSINSANIKFSFNSCVVFVIDYNFKVKASEKFIANFNSQNTSK